MSCDEHEIPQTKADYERAYMANYEVTGYGPEGHEPLPVSSLRQAGLVRCQAR